MMTTEITKSSQSVSPEFGNLVRRYIPTAEGDELAMREALIKARDWASSLLGRTQSSAAYEMARKAHDVAGMYVFASDASQVQLNQAINLCRSLVRAAALYETLEAGSAA